MKLLLSLFPLLFVISCVSKSETVEEQKSKQTSASLKGAGYLSEEDTKAKTYLEDQLRPIKDNVKRINAVPGKEWSSIVTKDLTDEEERGEATFYYYNSSLSKIAVQFYGETGQQLMEYYLMKDKLSFVLERDIKYNRPVYNTAHAGKNEDSVAFDTTKSEITETRYYFQYGILVYVAGSKHEGSPLSKDYLDEKQHRLLTGFTALVKLSKH